MNDYIEFVLMLSRFERAAYQAIRDKVAALNGGELFTDNHEEANHVKA